jgi:hypothetical protein
LSLNETTFGTGLNVIGAALIFAALTASTCGSFSNFAWLYNETDGSMKHLGLSFRLSTPGFLSFAASQLCLEEDEEDLQIQPCLGTLSSQRWSFASFA